MTAKVYILKNRLLMNLRKLLSSIGLPVFLLFSIAANAQDKQITGRVSDSTGKGIPGVSVSVKNLNSRGTTTSENGSFSLSVPSNATTLVFSSVGYDYREVNIDGSSVNVTLTTASSNLNEVIIIGYGTSKKKDLTGAVTAITSKDFNKGAIVSPEQLIAG